MFDINGQGLKDYVLTNIRNDISVCEDYYDSVIKKTMKERYDAYYADEAYYNKKFPNLSKKSSLVDTSVADTIEWALPSLVRLFFGAETPVTISGVHDADQKPAEVMNSLIDYQINRKNNSFIVFYNWFKDALIGFGVVKCIWERETVQVPKVVNMSYGAYQELSQNPSVQVVGVQTADMFGNVTVSYLEKVYKKNNPKVENILISEFLFPPRTKNIEDAPFVAHKKRVTLSYLYQKAKDGIYANVDKIKGNPDIDYDEIERDTNDNYDSGYANNLDRARTEVLIYECYTKLDINGDGILEDLIVTVCENEILRLEENPFGRHPFFILTPVKDPHRVFPKRAFPEMIGQLQHLKTALIRQMVINISLTNDPRLIMSEDAININDYIEGKAVIRKKAGYAMNDIVMPMPIQPLHPWTFQFLEYVEGQKESRTGITRYNQGLDGNSLNKMLALDTPIPMADGSYKLNKDIVADDMIIGSSGEPTRVLEAHPIQIPDRAFELTFKNGDVIRAGGEHLWSVKCKKNKKFCSQNIDFETMKTEDIYDEFISGNRILIPTVGKVNFTEKELPLDPYILGLWLGDGNSHTNRFTTMDNEILLAFENWSKQFYGGGIEICSQQNSGKAITYSLVNTPFRRILKDLKCLKDSRYDDTKNNVKHIPEIYLQGSFEQRLALVRGLIDTDGCVYKNSNQAVFCNSEPALIETFVKLIESFGIKPNVKWVTPATNFGGNCRPHARVSFNLPYCPASLPRKVDRWKEKSRNLNEQALVNIQEIKVEPMRCLSVEADDRLYCCGLRFTVTRNTATGISAIMNASNQRLELIARMFSETGIRDLYRFLISLNQKFVDQNVVIRVTDKELTVTPDDLAGDIDLVINAGTGVSTKEQNMMYIQTFMTSILQLISSGIPVATPTNIYNLMKRWITESGLKNFSDYITDPAVVQQRAMIETQMRAQILSTLPLPIQQEYMTTGTLRPEILAQLPPEIQQILVGDIFGGQQRNPNQASNGSGQGEFGGAGAGISGGLGTGVSGQDNRKTQGLQSSGLNPVQSNPFGS